MEKRISYFLGQNGYLKMLTTLSEFTIFFKKESGFVDLLLHSTGNGGGDYTSDVTSVNNKLYKNKMGMFDFIKGIAIFAVVLCHTVECWKDDPI